MEIAILLLLILLNGALATSEIALVTSRKGRLLAHAEQGDRGARAALRLAEEPTRFLSTVQIGITSIGIMNGIVGEAVLAAPVAAWLQTLGMRAPMSGYVATAIVVVAITYFSIVLGELVPKRIAQIKPEPVARFVARPLEWLSLLTKPFVHLLATSTQFVITLLGLKERDQAGLVEEDIHSLLLEGTQSGAIEQNEREMVRNVFRLDDRLLGSLMVPRRDLVVLDASRAWNENAKVIESHDHSRFPVVRGGFNDIVGVISARTLLARTLKGEEPELATLARPAFFVPEAVTGMEMLEHFKESGRQVALVVDEFGELVGMVTLRDVIEAITGEFKTSRAEDSWAVRRDDGSWLLDGLIPIPEMKDALALTSVPEEDRATYQTLSGMLLLLLGRLARTGDKLDWGGWRFEIVDLDNRRIDKVLATPIAPTEGPPQV
jgi:putative hemolysin